MFGSTRRIIGGAYDGAWAEGTDHKVAWIDYLGRVHDGPGEGRWPYQHAFDPPGQYVFDAWVAVPRCECGILIDIPVETCLRCGATLTA